MPWQTSSIVPINPVHAAVGKTGKVLFFGGSGNDAKNMANSAKGVALWDVNNGTFSNPTVPLASNGNPIDIFCAGQSFRPNGNLFVAGGTLQYDPFKGIPDCFVFDFINEQWIKVASMNRGRWYPTVLTLGNGQIFALSGLNINGNLDRNPEIFDGTTGWQIFTQTTSPFPMYAHLFLLSSGKLFYSGAQLGGNNGVSPCILTLPTSFGQAIAAQTVSGLTNAEYGNQGASLLLPPAQDQKVMIIGGGANGIATNRVNIVNLNANNPNYAVAPSLRYARMHHNAVILPNRTVFVCNGSGGEEDISKSTLPAEIYNPATNAWTTVETPSVKGRVYHSVVLLLPDGSVLTAGGNPQRGSYENRIELYRPAYMAQVRPTISGAPRIAYYNTTITIQTNQAANIKWVHLIRPMAPTHGLDTEQRLVDLPISLKMTSSLNVQITANRNLAPPGYYMLFIVNNSNVPSIASWIKLA